MTLQQQAIDTIESLPEEKLPILIQFANFLISDDSFVEKNDDKGETVSEKRKKMYGVLKGKVKISDDFNEIPDCFKEYV